MARRRRMFGPLFYGTLALAALVLIGHATLRAWPAVRRYFEIRALAQQLREGLGPDQVDAASRLGGIGLEAVPTLLIAMRDDDPEVRRLTCFALSTAGTDSDATFPTLLAALDDDRETVRLAAAEALGYHLRLAGAGIPEDRRRRGVRALREATRDEDPRVVASSVRALADLGPEARPAIPELLTVLERGDRALRVDAAQALIKIDPSTITRVLPAFPAEVRNADLGRSRVIWAFQETAADRKEDVVPVLLDLLEQLDPGAPGDVRVARYLAAVELLKITSMPHEPALVAVRELAEDVGQDSNSRGVALQQLRRFRPEALADLVPALKVQLRSERPGDRRAAMLLLGNLGPGATAALPILRKIAADPGSDEARLAAHAVRAIEADSAQPPDTSGE